MAASFRNKNDHQQQTKDDLESTVGWGYEGYGGQRWQWNERSGGVATWGKGVTRISAELTNFKRVVEAVVVSRQTEIATSWK